MFDFKSQVGIFFAILLIVGFQNCSPSSIQPNGRAQVTIGEDFSSSCPQGSTNPSCTTAQKSCVFEDETVPHGEFIVAYEKELALNGSACQSEVRICSNGTLSGSYPYRNCLPQQCSEVYPQSLCNVYIYLFGRWPDNEGAYFWGSVFQNNNIPEACWYRRISQAAKGVDCESHKKIFGYYPTSSACPLTPRGDAPRSRATAECP